MAGFGPAPKPAAERRRNNPPAANVRKIPADGRQGRPAPPWPLDECQPPPVWHELWATPVALLWEQNDWTRVVARYAVMLGKAESPSATGPVLTETRQLEDRLGLTPLAMLHLRWEIVPADESTVQAPPPVAPTRLRVIAEEYQHQQTG